ncbi:DNA primase [Limisalsivibrio acetivorans]|uniref:DNA primase n=1 Tax=Limisalsivibrio acetivorans TaxID=1304888 RepID=UPI0003B2ED0B|nr:DNA primase [Limisalsivibrio acetivorans]
MMIPQSVVDEVLDSADILDVVGEVVKLKKAGTRYKGLCPFHSEKTPSFTVTPEKNLFHCFGCGAGGNIFTFVSRFHNLGFPDAVMFLAERYGISVTMSEEQGKSRDIATLHEEILTETKRRLISPEGKEAREYLKKREFSSDLAEEFGIGYFPQKIDPQPYMKKYGREILYSSGLFVEGRYGARMRFFNRLSFPIRSITGRVVGFSGRSLDGSNPKYMNSPETEAFKKRELLYNIDMAKASIKQSEVCIVTEGYFDVMRLQEKGFTNSVATMGTSLTKEHVNLLKRYASEIILLFDGDDAGTKAAFKSLDVFLESNFFPYVAFLPKGSDPDTYLFENGKDAFNRVLENKRDLLIFTADMMRRKASDFNRKMKYLEALKEKVMRIRDPYRKDHYVEQIASRFEVDADIMKKDVDLSIAKTTLRKTETSRISYICEREFIASLAQLPEDVGHRLIEDLREDFFHDPVVKKIFQKVVELFDRGGNIEVLVNDQEIGEDLASLLVQQEGVEDHYRAAMENRERIIRNAMPELRKDLTKKLSSAKNKDEIIELLKLQDKLIRNEIVDRNTEV